MLCRPRQARTSYMNMACGRSISGGVNCYRTASRYPLELARSKSLGSWFSWPIELVTKNDIMSGVWPDAIVGENTLQVHISAIRKALGPDRAMLKTASGRGYRLLGNWTPRQHGSVSALSTSPPMRAPGAAPVNNNFPLIVGRLRNL